MGNLSGREGWEDILSITGLWDTGICLPEQEKSSVDFEMHASGEAASFL